jgi:small-conductance mechanosensitive channel
MARPDNLTYVVLSVTVLILGYLAALLIGTFLIVDFLLVRLLEFEIPNILRDATVFTLFFVGVLLILYRRTELDVTGLFTTAGILSIVIGLALQDTLGNVFSGLAIQTERSFNVGDWVRFGEEEGVVVDVSWRATKLRTRQNDLVIIPNTQISNDVLVNYSAPTRIHAVREDIGVHYRHPPAHVIAAIEEAADQTEAILKRPRVDVRTQSPTGRSTGSRTTGTGTGSGTPSTPVSGTRSSATGSRCRIPSGTSSCTRSPRRPWRRRPRSAGSGSSAICVV